MAATVRFGKDYWVWHWWNRWGLVLLGLSVMVAVRVGKRVHWSVGFLAASVLGSAIFNFHWVGNGSSLPVVMLAQPDPLVLARATQNALAAVIGGMGIVGHGATAALTFLLILAVFSELSRKSLKNLILSVGLIGYLNAFVMLFQFTLHDRQNQWGGLIGNPSMSACFSAATLPLLAGAWWAVIPTVAAVLLTKTSMGVGVLAVSLGVWFAAHFKTWKGPLLVAISIMGLGLLTQGHEFTSGTGRFGVWQLALNWFSLQNSWWTGVGTGLAAIFVPEAQRIADPQTTELFTFMHNEPLQVLVEQGLFGAAASILVFVSAVWKARLHPRMLASLMGFAAMSLGDYPLRTPITAIAVAVVVTMALRTQKAQSN